MISDPTGKRDSWSSRFGFIMSAAGSAVGLGNIWKFPYLCGTNGGALFLLIYILFVVLLGYPILLTELAIGRHGERNAVDSCRKINKHWGFAGAFGVAGALAVLSYYCVVGGWVIKYILLFISGNIPSPSYFSSYTAQSAEPVLWQAVFLIINAAVVVFGVSKGIERVSSLLLPLLLVFLIGIMIYSLSLPGAENGVSFFLKPRLSAASSPSDLASVAVKALGQVFFSLSLGMGTLITYGSYLDKESDLCKSTAHIISIDTAIAVISGLTVLPAVFSLGLEPNEGAGLIFSTLTGVFGSLSGGAFIGSVFFLLVLFAAVTSSISLFEVIAAFLTEFFGISRIKAVIFPLLLVMLLGVPASLSFGRLSELTIMGLNVFDFFVFLSDHIIMPLGGLFLCILAGWIWGKEGLYGEISSNGKYRFSFSGVYNILIKYVAPLFIIIVFVTSLI